MLALWIALRMGLDRPYWAMATVYIVAQPLTGAMRSKAAYRFYGTILGAVACLAFIPNLVNAPVLLISALSLWIGVASTSPFSTGHRAAMSFSWPATVWR